VRASHGTERFVLQRVELCSVTKPIPDEALYRASRVSEETGGEGTPAPGVEVLQHLWDLTG
jgi:hypothetical protein